MERNEVDYQTISAGLFLEMDENYILKTKPDAQIWRKGDDKAKWEAVKALLVEGASVEIEREFNGHPYTVTGKVWEDGVGTLVGGHYISINGGPTELTSVTVTAPAPNPKLALAKQLEADGWAWRPVDDGVGGYTYRRIGDVWCLGGENDLLVGSTAELILYCPTITRHPAFTAGEAKGYGDE